MGGESITMSWINPFRYRYRIYKNPSEKHTREYALIAQEKNTTMGYRSKILFRYNKELKKLQIGKTSMLDKVYQIPIFNIKISKY